WSLSAGCGKRNLLRCCAIFWKARKCGNGRIIASCVSLRHRLWLRLIHATEARCFPTAVWNRQNWPSLLQTLRRLVRGLGNGVTNVLCCEKLSPQPSVVPGKSSILVRELSLGGGM